MADDAATFLEGFVHEETQVHNGGVDLTLATVHRIEAGGAVDFGGGELGDADTAPVDPERHEEADEYGWWDLDAGTYLVGFNETLDAANTTFSLQPRTELVERGVTHPTLFVSRLPALPLTVPEPGIALKQNARISTLRSPIR